MTPAQAIVMLNSQIAKHGQTVTIQRDGMNTDVRAFVRPMAPKALTDGVQQARSSVVLSPSSFPGWEPLPQQADRVSIAGGAFVEIDEPEDIVRMDDVPVRINLVVVA